MYTWKCWLLVLVLQCYDLSCSAHFIPGPTVLKQQTVVVFVFIFLKREEKKELNFWSIFNNQVQQ